MTLPNSGAVTASWAPKKRRDGSLFTATFAGYKELSGDFIRVDNAHSRDTLHVDSRYHGWTAEHDENVDLVQFQLVNRRRLAVVRLMQILEQTVCWQIPAWFYMPWCVWWEEYRDFPEKLRHRKPQGVLMSNMCEAVLACLCFEPSITSRFVAPTGISKVPMDAIEESINRVVFAFEKAGTFELRQIVFGRLEIVPFLMYAPPGSKIQGPEELLKQLPTD